MKAASKLPATTNQNMKRLILLEALLDILVTSGPIPVGHFYAGVMEAASLEDVLAAVATAKLAGVVSVSNNLISPNDKTKEAAERITMLMNKVEEKMKAKYNADGLPKANEEELKLN